LLDHIEAIHQRQMDMLEFARHVTEEAFAPGDGADIYVEGAGNILSLPEFSGHETICASWSMSWMKNGPSAI
jgi:hypothetical protein